MNSLFDLQKIALNYYDSLLDLAKAYDALTLFELEQSTTGTLPPITFHNPQDIISYASLLVKTASVDYQNNQWTLQLTENLPYSVIIKGRFELDPATDIPIGVASAYLSASSKDHGEISMIPVPSLRVLTWFSECFFDMNDKFYDPDNIELDSPKSIRHVAGD